jgi:hypothetical protein
MLIILSDRLIVLTFYSRVAGQTRRLATEIAQSVEALGDKFRPAMSWLKYIQTAYAAGPASTTASSTGQGTWIVTDDKL